MACTVVDNSNSYDRLKEIESWMSLLDANLKILAMPFKDEVAWGVHITDKKGRYDITGQGKSLSEAVNNIWADFLDVQKYAKLIPF